MIISNFHCTFDVLFFNANLWYNINYDSCLIFKVDLPPDSLIGILTEMAEIEVRLNGGTCEKIHLGSLISAFHMIRSKLKPADG